MYCISSICPQASDVVVNITSHSVVTTPYPIKRLSPFGIDVTFTVTNAKGTDIPVAIAPSTNFNVSIGLFETFESALVYNPMPLAIFDSSFDDAFLSKGLLASNMETITARYYYFYRIFAT